LKNLDVDIEQTRQEILNELDPYSSVKDIGTAPSSSSPLMPPKSETPQNAESAKPRRDLVDISKRYDVYCTEQTHEVVVYRNALFKGTRGLLPKYLDDSLSEFVELEQADGQAIFIARYSVIKFCEPGVTPNPETIPGKKP
jgi:hypothetical protein